MRRKIEMSNIKLVNVTEEIVRGLVSFLLHGVDYILSIAYDEICRVA